MKETMPPFPSGEDAAAERNTTEEEEAQYAEWMRQHPETSVDLDTKRECGPDVAAFEEMVAAFETDHSLEALHAIIDLTPEDAPQHPVREPAKRALEPIVAKLKTIREETDISDEALKELKARYKRLSQAVGMINNNKVDHTR